MKKINYNDIDAYDEENVKPLVGNFVKFCDGFSYSPIYTEKTYRITSYNKHPQWGMEGRHKRNWEYYVMNIIDIETGNQYKGGFAVNKFIDANNDDELKLLYRNTQIEKLLV